MPNYPSDFNDTVVYQGVDLYIPKDCSCTVFEDSRVFLFGEWYLNGQPIMSGSAAISGQEVSVGPTQPVDPGMTLWFDTSAGYGELKVKVGGSWKTVEDPNDAFLADEVSIGVGQPVPANYELWVDTSVQPENLKAKVSGTWKSINSEVAIGGVEPTDQAIELWVDTASPAPVLPENYVTPGNALGIVAVGTFVPGATLAVSAGDNLVTNLITMNTVVGRRYRITCTVRAITLSTPQTVGFYLYDGSTNLTTGNASYLWIAGNYHMANLQFLVDGDGLVHSYNIHATPGTFGTFYIDAPSKYYLEDLGPISRPAYPLTAPPPDGYVSPGNALGVVAIGTLTNGSPQNIPADTTVQVTGNIPLTSPVGRRIKISFSARTSRSVGALSYSQLILRDGTTALYSGHPTFKTEVSTAFNIASYSWIIDGDNIARSWNVAIRPIAVGIDIWTDTPSFFYIEDVGPNTSPALPIPATAPAWTPVSAFLNSWVNLGASRPPTTYRKIGDVVDIRVAVKSGTPNVPIFTLPVGFRPQYILDFEGRDNAGSCNFNVASDGSVTWYGSVGNNTIVCVNCSFSVTP